MTRRAAMLRAGSVACVALVGLVWWPAPATGAESDVESGWWHRPSGADGEPAPAPAPDPGGPGAPPPTLPPAPAPVPVVPIGDDGPPPVPGAVPPPAAVPDGGLYVANDLFGPVAVSALRFHVGEVGETRLTLRFASGAGSVGPLPIVACPLLEGFAAVTNGAWRDRPAHDCARVSSSGSVGADGTLTFSLSSAFQQAGQSTLDVVLLPAPGDGTPFSAPLQPVEPGDLASLGSAPARPTPTSMPPFAPDPEAPAAAFNPVPAARSGGTVSRPQPRAAAPAPAGPATANPTASPSGSALQPVVDVFDDRPWARWVATSLLGALAVLLAAASTNRLPSPVGARGVGRFARDRSGPPPALT